MIKVFSTKGAIVGDMFGKPKKKHAGYQFFPIVVGAMFTVITDANTKETPQ